MNIVDSFFFLFKTNAKEAQRDVDAFDKATKNTQDTLNSADQSAQKLGLSFSKLALAGVAALEGFASLNKLKEGIANAIDYNATIEKTAKLTGINARELSLWNDVVAKAGGNPGGKEYLNFITQLNQKYAALGVNDRLKRVNQDLVGIATKFQELERNSPGSSQALAEKLGIGPDLWLALKDGPGVLQANLDAMGQLDNTTEETAAAAFQLKQAWGSMGIALRSAFTDATPMLKDLLEIATKGAQILLGLADSVWNFRVSPILKRLYEQDFGSGSGSSPAASGNASAVLPLISQYETGNRNVLNASGPGGTPASTASGYYQITNGTWRDFAPKAGVSLSRYPTAISAPRDIQEKVASLIYQQRGLQPWESDTRLLAAVGNGAANAAAAAQSGIATADSAQVPIGSNTSSKSITIGAITIHSAATDAKGLSNDLYGEIASAAQSHDDGIKF